MSKDAQIEVRAEKYLIYFDEAPVDSAMTPRNPKKRR
jgi:hypothetical protein